MKSYISVIHADIENFIDVQLKWKKLFAYKRFFQLPIIFKIVDYTKNGK